MQNAKETGGGGVQNSKETGAVNGNKTIGTIQHQKIMAVKREHSIKINNKLNVYTFVKQKAKMIQ